MSKKQTLFAIGCFALTSLLTPLLQGQTTGSFSGTVTDNAGAVVSGANVKITSQATGLNRETKTDDTGHYLVPLLPVGFYSIRVEAQGFALAEQTAIRLQVDETREFNFTLQPATVTTSVEVNATAVAVDTSAPTLGQVITSEQVSSLPLNGREFVQLATLTPGTTQETNPLSFFNAGPSSEVSARGTYSLSVGGSRAQSTDWLLDGNDDNELTAGGIGFKPSIDAIQEFKVLSYNYSAEYGTRAGPTVLVATKSGTNQLHGSLFEFFRNTKLNAADRFVAPGAPKDKFNLNQFGGSLGGALKKDKTFFFMDYQGTRKRRGIVSTGLIPTPDMIGLTKGYGDFTLNALGQPAGQLTNPYSQSPFQCDASGIPIRPNSQGIQTGGTACNKIPQALIDPTGQAMLKLYPTPDVSNPVATGFNYLNIPTRSLNDDEFDVKVDHSFSSKDLAYARFSYEQAASLVPGGSPGFAEISAFASTQNITNHARNAVISETHIFNPRNFNQFTFGFNRIFNHILSFGDRSCQAFKLGLLGANINPFCGDPNAAGVVSQSTTDCLSCGLSSTNVGQYWTLGDRGFAPFLGGTNIFTWSDSFDMIRGKHEIRLGGQLRAQQMNTETNGFQDGFILNFGSLTGDAAADLLLGQIGTGSLHDQTFDGATTGRRWKLLRPFVQDNWRVTNNLTLNLGLAWALVTPTTEVQGRQSNFNIATGKYYVAGNSAHRSCAICVPTDGRVGIQMDTTAFEPRIGMAWKPFGDAKTAVRAGYAIYHDSSWNQGAQGLWQNPPYYAEIDNFSGLSPLQSLGTATCGFTGNQGCGLRAAFLPVITGQPDPSQFTGTIQAQNFNFKQGQVQQFTLNVEHEMPGQVVLTVGYAGSRSHHILMDGVNLNVNSPAACAGGPAPVAGYTLGCGPGGSFVQPPCVNWAIPCGPTSSGNPNAFDQIASNINDVGNARYDSLQVKAETKSARHGLYALVGYTWSHTFDSGLADGLGTFPGATYWPLPGTTRADWGLSALNVNNQFTASVLYELPFGRGKKFGSGWSRPTNAVFGGWEGQVIQRAMSGFPLFIVNSSNQSGVNFQWNGSTLNRPDMVGDPNRPGPVAANPNCAVTPPTRLHVTGGDWFNPCAFAPAAPNELGNAPRAPVSGPNYINTDFSLIKHIAVTERMRLDFRSEFFNLWNHPHLYLPGSPGVSNMQDVNALLSFGVANATVNSLSGDSRVIQFALKLLF